MKVREEKRAHLATYGFNTRFLTSRTEGARTSRIQQPHQKVEPDFTDARVTPVVGLAFVTQAAQRLGLLTLLDGCAPCKQRDRGASDQANLMAPIGSLASGRGKLCDLDDLWEDGARRRMFGLVRGSGSRRLAHPAK